MARTRRKILCIEDDRETAALIAEELGDRGFHVSTAYDGQEGFVAILREKPDLILCDIGLPSMSGYEVLERMNEVAPVLGSIPFVFLTALADRDSELKGRRLGADDYVTKPIDFDILTAIINARLAGIARSGRVRSNVKLNDREKEVLTLVAQGKTSAQIARNLGIVKRTVDFHIDNARIKLGAATRSEAVIKAVAAGLIEP
jgi:DNA-binding response OmpR family regulator